MRILKSAVVLLTVTLPGSMLGACTVGPDYTPPKPDVPTNWTEHAATPAEIARTNQELKKWWSGFGDQALDRLVEQALATNLDLKIASQRLIGARAARVIAASADAPHINAGATAADLQASNTVAFPPVFWEKSNYQFYQIGFDATWEIDVFGGTRRAVQAAEADYDATIEARRAILVSLLAELATDYASLRASQERLAIANRNVTAARASLDLTQRSFTRGLGNDLEVAQAQAQLQLALSAPPPLHAAIARMTHAISVLLGQVPGGALEQELAGSAGKIPAAPGLPVSLPSEVIANRPDIRRAERRFAAATARIGVAVADMYPHFSIPLSLTPETSTMAELFRLSSLAWHIGLSATQHISTGGALSARVRQAQEEAEEARLAYQQTVLRALQNVEDGLINYTTEGQRDVTLKAAAEASELAFQRSTRLYQAGLTDFLHVLVDERAAYAAEDMATQSELESIADAIALYKALGAGWQDIYPDGAGIETRPGPPVDPAPVRYDGAASRPP
jgi:NodT family efflux transporter outer membrane factor (OMF) lipoprotein